MTTYNQNTPEWLEMRRKMIGASDAPVIMDMSPYNTAYNLWVQKETGTNQIVNPAMRRGTELEDKARMIACLDLGICLEPKVIFHSEIKYMMASLDGIDSTCKTALEIKCANKEDHILAANNKIPSKYFAQLQHQIEVCELDKILYFSFDGENGIFVVVRRDQSFIQEMLEKEKQFYVCMTTKTPPPLSKKDYIIKQDDNWVKASEEYRQVNLQMKALEKKEKELKEQIITLTEDKNAYGNGITVTKYAQKGTVDYSSIPQLKDVDLEAYRKPTHYSWRISTK